METWLLATLTVVGSALGAYVATRVAIAVLETKMIVAEDEIKALRKSLHDLREKFPEMVKEYVELWRDVRRG